MGRSGPWHCANSNRPRNRDSRPAWTSRAQREKQCRSRREAGTTAKGDGETLTSGKHMQRGVKASDDAGVSPVWSRIELRYWLRASAIALLLVAVSAVA